MDEVFLLKQNIVEFIFIIWLEEAIVKVLDDVLFIKQNIVELNLIVWWDETIADLGDDRCVELCKMLHQHVQLLNFSVSDNLAITYQRKV